MGTCDAGVPCGRWTASREELGGPCRASRPAVPVPTPVTTEGGFPRACRREGGPLAVQGEEFTGPAEAEAEAEGFVREGETLHRPGGGGSCSLGQG